MIAPPTTGGDHDSHGTLCGARHRGGDGHFVRSNHVALYRPGTARHQSAFGRRDQGPAGGARHRLGDMPMAMMWGMGLIWLLVIIFLLLGIAAFIKYLRS